MRENVGGADQTMRVVLGPLLVAAGYLWLGGRRGKTPGLLTMMGGVLVLETVFTRTCPLNRLLGLDTTEGF